MKKKKKDLEEKNTENLRRAQTPLLSFIQKETTLKLKLKYFYQSETIFSL